MTPGSSPGFFTALSRIFDDFRLCKRKDQIPGANGFCGWCTAKPKIKALPLQPEAALLVS